EISFDQLRCGELVAIGVGSKCPIRDSAHVQLAVAGEEEFPAYPWAGHGLGGQWLRTLDTEPASRLGAPDDRRTLSRTNLHHVVDSWSAAGVSRRSVFVRRPGVYWGRRRDGREVPSGPRASPRSRRPAPWGLPTIGARVLLLPVSCTHFAAAHRLHPRGAGSGILNRFFLC